MNERIGFWLQRRAGAIKPSANRITILRDDDSTGRVTYRGTFLAGLSQPFGMAVVDDRFYVANTDGVWRYVYHDGDLKIVGKGEKILDLPAGGYNNHWTRNLLASVDQKSLFVTVGSGSNAGEHGLLNEAHRADILEINLDGTGLRVFASGMRNPVGLSRIPATNDLWTVVNERDMMGNDLVPDYLTLVRDGGFYGWPYSYWGQHVAASTKDSFGNSTSAATPDGRPDLVARAITPDYALGAHVSPLGLTFYSGSSFPAHYRGGAFIAEHGSWNRNPSSGYKVVFIPFRDGRPNGPPEDFLTGFKPDERSSVAHGRPVGIIVDRSGALLVADDTGNIVWRVSADK